MNKPAATSRTPDRVLLSIAGALTSIWIVIWALGWKECTTILTMTMPPDATSFSGTAERAAAYLAAYFATLIIVPTLVLAAGLDWAWRRWRWSQVRR
jgi:hypothetical protein